MADSSAAPNIPVPPTPERTSGPDGETIKDWSYYDLLGVAGNSTDIEIKKAYRKLAIKLHPDKNVGDEGAAARFQEVSEAYTVLSDSNLRAVYNKQGKSNDISNAAEAMPDPGQMFSQLFGGAAFMDWIGEISLGKDVSKAFEMSTTEEEREEMKAEYAKEVNGETPSSVTTPSPAPQSSLSHTAFEEPPTYTSPTSPHIIVGDDKLPSKGPSTTSISSVPATASSPTPGSSSAADHALAAEKKALAEKEKREQREKMEAYEKERSEEKKERVRMLIEKLKDRIRPMVDAKDPGNGEDPEVKRYSERIRIECQDLAMESFGIEICHLIGEIYMQKSSSYIRLHKKPSSNILGIPAWGSRMKEKWSTVKEGFSFLSVGMDVQSAMADMERRQQKGELDEDEMKGLESDLSGKLLLVAWKGSKFELSNVLRQVVDGVLLKEQGVTEQILMNRAKAILLTGAILKSVVPDETDSERRELERMVAEANAKRKEKGKKAPKGKAGAVGGVATPPKGSPSVPQQEA